MLIDFERGCKAIKPKTLKEMAIYQKFERTHQKRTIDAIFKRLNSFLDSQNPSQKSELIWVRLAKMMGRQSETPNKDICFIEDRVLDAVGDGPEFLMLCGTLFMIAIAERPERWLSSKVSKGSYDPHTGKEIAWRSYWIDKGAA